MPHDDVTMLLRLARAVKQAASRAQVYDPDQSRRLILRQRLIEQRVHALMSGRAVRPWSQASPFDATYWSFDAVSRSRPVQPDARLMMRYMSRYMGGRYSPSLSCLNVW
ncbi:MAG: hypothetical protein OEY86_07090 [Nitrospira sp.]|nr:hypothetical protein [Nitrospira sp.]